MRKSIIMTKAEGDFFYAISIKISLIGSDFTLYFSHQMGLASIECGEGEAPQDVEEANSEREPLIRKETSDCVIVV